ncbi:50S ribosomal protein L10 [Candidatus Dependentiae bacterium]
MNREAKARVVSQVREAFDAANATFVVYYKGLIVRDMQKLRNDLRTYEAILKVAKVRLIRRAVEDVGNLGGLQDSFGGQVALVFANSQVSDVAKKLVKLAKENDNFDVKAGFFESKFLNAQSIKALATLPSREELLAMLAGTLKAPISCLARSLDAVVGGLARSLQGVVEKKQNLRGVDKKE